MTHEFLNGCVQLLSGKESLINTLQASLETEFERKLFEASINNLLDAYNPLRFNNFAYSARELVRHVLDRLSPDGAVLACDWYKNGTDRKDGITRAQRVTYAIHGGLSPSYVAKTLGIDTTTINKKINVVVTNLSKHTHIQPETIDITPDKLDAYVSETLESVDKFFIFIRESKAAVSEAFIDKIYDEIINLVNSETLESIDEIAKHYAIDEVSIDEALVDFIDNEHVELTITGSICAELQFGSNSDMRRGDGITLDHSFPFSCRLRSEVGNPGVFPYGPENFEVSNDDWYE